jgi:hypothetical protein
VFDVSDGATAVIAAISGGGPVQLFDLTDARKPARVATYKPPGPAQRVALHDGQFYIAAGPAGLQVVNLATPSAPTAIGAHKTAGFTRDVAVSGRSIFVIVGAEEIVVLRRDEIQKPPPKEHQRPAILLGRCRRRVLGSRME